MLKLFTAILSEENILGEQEVYCYINILLDFHNLVLSKLGSSLYMHVIPGLHFSAGKNTLEETVL